MPTKQLALAVVGPGLIGKTFLKQLQIQSNVLNIHLYGISNSKKMVFDENGIALNQWEDRLNKVEVPMVDLEDLSKKLTDQVKSLAEQNGKSTVGVMVDCTANDKVADHYASWLSKGLNVITPNKRLHSGDLKRYKQVQAILNSESCQGAKYLYEGVVGAGLPVMDTLKRMVKSGDNIFRIEGVFSGTMSYIFNTMSADISFSQVIQLAKDQGFTEPDPREDLDGQDVARKVVALGRECGLDLELSHIQVQSLVSDKVASAQSVEEALQLIKEDDQSMESQRLQAEQSGCVLRYVGILDVTNKQGLVKIEQYPLDHAFGRLKGSENIVMIKSERYDEVGMTIMGPGAGAEVTAAAVFGDLLSLI